MNGEPRERNASYLAARLEALWARVRRRVLDTLPESGVAAEEEREVERRARERAARIAALATNDGEFLALPALAAEHGLSDFDEELLVLLLGPRVDLAFGELLDRLRTDPLRQGLDVDLALTVLCEDFPERLRRRWDLGPDSPLLRAGLVRSQEGAAELGEPDLSRRLALAETTLRRLLDGPPLAPPAPPHGLRAPASRPEDLCMEEATSRAFTAAVSGAAEGALRVLIQGPPGTGKSTWAEAVARASGRLVADEGPLSARLEAAVRHGAIAIMNDCECFFGRREEAPQALSDSLAALDRFGGSLILTTSRRELLDEALDHRIARVVELELPSAALRERIWGHHLGAPLPERLDLAWLARRFAIPGALIRNAVALARANGPEPPGQEDLVAAARAQLRERLGRYAERSTSVSRLDDLILPDEVSARIREVLSAARARRRVLLEWGFGEHMGASRGLSCLFDGDPGTGKSLSAEVIAAELDLPLYRVNAANVVDKYIGETEKNLTRIFRDAAGSHAVLLFDEADALFSRRVDVRTANDRYTNLEVNVLLQLIERYEGLVILTTNLRQGIDPAFERRFTFKIHFPFPDPLSRERIWRRLTPASAPLAADVDFERVAEAFELSGGAIRNALLRAAYRAAAEDRPIALDDIASAAQAECAAAGRLYRHLSAEEP